MSFEEAAAKAKTFTTRPSDADLLKLYGLYKQATVGDNTTSMYPSAPHQLTYRPTLGRTT